MKKLICALFVILSVLLVSCSEGSTPSDKNPYNLYAIIKLPNGEVVEGKVEEYYRYNEVCIEIHIDDDVYFVHPMKVAFISYSPVTEKGSAE